MARRTYRKHPPPKVKKWGKWQGYGPQVVDANSGFVVPKRLTVVDANGNRVYHRWEHGSRDRPKSW